MTLEELARFDGREGRPAYAAVNGRIYDFTGSKLWAGGNHLQQHQAGQDLTEALLKAPHVRAVVERFPVVGQLEEPAPQPTAGGMGKWLLGAAVLAIAVFIFMLLR
jgi:predicted heme/steroid binding protein